LKDAVSDGVKRCAMRVGLGLHLWSQNDYYLDRQLADPDDVAQPEPVVEPVVVEPPPLSPAEKRMKTVKDAAWHTTAGIEDESERIAETKLIVEQAIATYGREPKNVTDVQAIVANIEELAGDTDE